MKIERRRLFTVIATLALAVAIAYCGFPRLWVGPMIELNRLSAGLGEKTLTLSDPEKGDHEIHYLEGGDPDAETVVLLHGIFAEKDHWVDFARAMGGKYRLIIPDLPAFGESTRLADGDYRYSVQVVRLERFFQAIGLKRFHLAGNSLGGAMTAFYSLAHPEKVLSAAFIGAPHGIETPELSDFDRMMQNRQFPLIAHDAEEFEKVLDILFVRRPFLPYPIYVDSRDRAIQASKDKERIMLQQVQDHRLLQKRLPALKVRTLTLWGGSERVFHPTGADVIRKLLPGQPVIVMPETGHLPFMEKPAETARHYLEFLAGAPPQK